MSTQAGWQWMVLDLAELSPAQVAEIEARGLAVGTNQVAGTVRPSLDKGRVLVCALETLAALVPPAALVVILGDAQAADAWISDPANGFVVEPGMGMEADMQG